jgi:hypothetical protein
VIDEIDEIARTYPRVTPIVIEGENTAKPCIRFVLSQSSPHMVRVMTPAPARRPTKAARQRGSDLVHHSKPSRTEHRESKFEEVN